MKAALLTLLLLLVPVRAFAQAPEEHPACPEPFAACLSAEQRDRVLKAIEELDEIHRSPAMVDIDGPIVVIRDWENRVFVNGGSTKPLRLKLTIGSTIDRDLEVEVPVQVHYREAPPQPWLALRLRVRAHAGILLPEAVRSVKDGEVDPFWYAGLDLDFLKLGDFNVWTHVGSAGPGLGVGVDVTKNFGTNVGMAVKWDGWTPTMLTGVYFAF